MIHELWQAPVDGRCNRVNKFRMFCEDLFHAILHELNEIDVIVHFLEDVRFIRQSLHYRNIDRVKVFTGSCLSTRAQYTIDKGNKFGGLGEEGKG